MKCKLTHLIKDKCPFSLDDLECDNASVFALVYKEKFKGPLELLDKISNDIFTIRATQESDAKKLVTFFAEQPKSAFEFFHPHGFDEMAVLNVIKNKASQTFVVTESESIVGYFFLRSFVNGKCIRGRMVHHKTRGRGVGKLMAKVIEEIATFEGQRMFASISPENLASLNSVKEVSNVRIIKTLNNGHYDIECTLKNTNQGIVSLDNQLIIAHWKQMYNLKIAA